MARDLDLDLVEVAPLANPPVCRIMDYGKYKYEEAQRARESRRKSSAVAIKEMKYRPKIGIGDFDTKTRKVSEFLAEGHKVKVTIMFRGREVFHPELGKKILDQVAERVVEVGKVEAAPRLDGRNMTMVLAPDKRAQAKRSTTHRDAAPASAPTRTGAAADGDGARHRRHQRRPRHRSRRRSRRPSRSWSPTTKPLRPPSATSTAGSSEVPGEHFETESNLMPKMKTNKAAAKRYRKTGTGKLRRQQSMRQHLFEKKSSTRTRRLDGYVAVDSGDEKRVKRLLAER